MHLVQLICFLSVCYVFGYTETNIDIGILHTVLHEYKISCMHIGGIIFGNIVAIIMKPVAS